MTPKNSVIAYCRECTQAINRPELVESCQGNEATPEPCPLYPYRLGEKRASVKEIRKFCLQCQGGKNHLEQGKRVKDCPSYDCTLYNFRLGTNPNRKGVGGHPFNVPNTNAERTIEALVSIFRD